MASPTAIPHPHTSSHHSHHHPPASSPPRPSGMAAAMGIGTPNNNRNSPPLLSPIYTRTAFSLPGGPGSPSNSFRNTASGTWTTAGVNLGGGGGGAGGGGLKSPTVVASSQVAQKDYFPERENHHHHRTSSTSSISSVESNGPTTPRTGEAPTSGLVGGAPLGRVRSIPLPSSYEAIKGAKEGWNGSQGWAGLSSFRSQALSTNSNLGASAASPNPSAAPRGGGGGGMGNLFRRLSLSSAPSAQNPVRRENNHHHGGGVAHPHRSASISYGGTSSGPAAVSPKQSSAAVIQETVEPATAGSSVGAAVTPAAAPASTPAVVTQKAGRGRRIDSGGAGGTAGSIKRKPSPHGERLLMGWTHAH